MSEAMLVSSLQPIIVCVISLIVEPLLDLLNLAGSKSLPTLAETDLLLYLLFLGRICDGYVVALTVRFDNAIIEHGFHMLGLLLDQLVLLLHLLHSLLEFVDAVELILNGLLLVH